MPLAAHILDLYDIHSRQEWVDAITERAAELMHRFIELLQNGEAIKSRELGHYASLLCISPHYLSDISREISGKPAAYWIDRFAITDIIHSVSDRGEIPDRNFRKIQIPLAVAFLPLFHRKSKNVSNPISQLPMVRGFCILIHLPNPAFG